ncbi:MAG: phosphotransferase [Chloroflexi bacterium]|nr:phosphotransferase [Chloroflexota bacterium]
MVGEGFEQKIIEVHGERGRDWLIRLPEIVSQCARRWSLTVMPPFEPLSYNYVAPALREDGMPAVLKLGVPNPELVTEIEALRAFRGDGIVRLLESDTDLGALLLERLEPGATLLSVEDDEEATSIAAGVMRQLWKPAPQDHPFPTAERWSLGFERLRKTFDGGTGPFPSALVERAEGLFSELLGSMGEPVLIHGDLHHENILSNSDNSSDQNGERGPWLAIDPKGLVAEREYEVGALLRNPMPRLLDTPHPERVTARRVARLSEELGFDRERIVGWGLSQAVLSAWWSYEDHGHGWEPAIAVAEIFAGL